MIRKIPVKAYKCCDGETFRNRCDASEHSFMLCSSLLKEVYLSDDSFTVTKIDDNSFGIYDSVNKEFVNKCMVELTTIYV